MVNAPLRKSDLRVDDYLDMLNLAKQLGDQKWQKEIIRKLERMNAYEKSASTYSA